jgi:hypothetical protein
VAQVKGAGGSIAGEYDLSLWEATGFAQRELLHRWLVSSKNTEDRMTPGPAAHCTSTKPEVR